MKEFEKYADNQIIRSLIAAPEGQYALYLDVRGGELCKW